MISFYFVIKSSSLAHKEVQFAGTVQWSFIITVLCIVASFAIDEIAMNAEEQNESEVEMGMEEHNEDIVELQN